MTGRELARRLMDLPNPDAPVFFWNPGEYWSPSDPVLLQDGLNPYGFIMVEKNMVSRHFVSEAARLAANPKKD
jgi:hypothetical protein